MCRIVFCSVCWKRLHCMPKINSFLCETSNFVITNCLTRMLRGMYLTGQLANFFMVFPIDWWHHSYDSVYLDWLIDGGTLFLFFNFQIILYFDVQFMVTMVTEGACFNFLLYTHMYIIVMFVFVSCFPLWLDGCIFCHFSYKSYSDTECYV